MRKILLTLLSCILCMALASAKNLTISKATTAPTIDGDESDWGGAWIDMTEYKTANTTNDFTSKMKLTYDNTNLYLIVKVTGDATPNNDKTAIPNTWERDCMELFISMDTANKADNSYYAGVWQIRKQRTPANAGQGIDGGAGGGNFVDSTLFTNIISSGEDDPYYIEAAIPWNTLTNGMGVDTNPWNGKMFKFDVGISDNTTGIAGGRTQQTWWNDNSDSQWNNTSKFGLITLSTPVAVDTRLIQYISYNAPASMKIGDADVQLSAYSSANLAVTYLSSNTSVATIVNNKIHVVGVGTCTITAKQAGNTTYQPVSISRALTITSVGGPVNPKLTIQKVSKAPTIDGGKTDWGTSWINLTKIKASNTTSAVQSKMQLAYDEKNLYVIVEVTGDNTPNNDAVVIPNTYERDCIELYVSLDTITKPDYSYHEGVWQIRKQRTPAEVGKGIDGGTGGGAIIKANSFNIVSSGLSSPYYVEAALPWDTLAQTMGKNGIPAWDRMQFKFDIQVADNTTGAAGGRTQQIFWNDNSDSQWNNTSKFGLIALQSPLVNGLSYDQLVQRISTLETTINKHQYVVKDTLHVPVIVLKETSGIVKLSGGEISIKLLPDFTNKYINVEANEMIIQLEVVDAEGIVLKTLQVNALSSSFDVAALKSGTYTLKLVTNKGVASSKFILKR